MLDSWEAIPEGELKLKKVVEKFETHCHGTQNVILYRYKFWTRNQNEVKVLGFTTRDLDS